MAPTLAPSVRWTLLHSGWIPSYTHLVDPSIRARGQFITPKSTAIRYQQIFIECGTSTNVGVRRVVTLGNAAMKAGLPSATDLKEATQTYYSGDTARRPAELYYSSEEWNEMHHFGENNKRFIIRVNQIHCALNYGNVGGQSDNSRLGTYGRVWVRDSTEVPDETELPVSGTVVHSLCLSLSLTISNSLACSPPPSFSRSLPLPVFSAISHSLSLCNHS